MSRVLDIDDDASLRFTLEAVLSDAGLVVEACDGGASGLAAFELHGADVVLNDPALPEVDGRQVRAPSRLSISAGPAWFLRTSLCRRRTACSPSRACGRPIRAFRS